jgi:site-specific recombinase XerD
MAIRLDAVSARERLKPRRDPYWQRVTKGCYLGFRRMSSESQGTWLARARDGATGKQAFKLLGELTETPGYMRFDAAHKLALAWFDHLDRGGSAGATTVRDICSKYVEYLRSVKTARAADDAEARFRNYVLDNERLAAVELSKLKPSHLEGWRNRLREMPTRSGGHRGERRSDSTLNRDMTCFRAALNLAYADGLVTSDFAWRRKLVPVKNADRRRELYLKRAQRKKFIEKASPDLGQFLRGLALVPLRPGALAALRVGDYDSHLKVLKVGKDKNGQERKIKLPEATAKFFAEVSKNKLAGDPLVSRADDKAWDKDAWKWPVKAAAAAAKLPAGTTAYTLRHSVISDLVHDGLDLLTVAQISGTSVAMIERHYGHLRSDVAAGALAKLVL